MYTMNIYDQLQEAKVLLSAQWSLPKHPTIKSMDRTSKKPFDFVAVEGKVYRDYGIIKNMYNRINTLKAELN